MENVVHLMSEGYRITVSEDFKKILNDKVSTKYETHSWRPKRKRCFQPCPNKVTICGMQLCWQTEELSLCTIMIWCQNTVRSDSRSTWCRGTWQQYACTWLKQSRVEKRKGLIHDVEWKVCQRSRDHWFAKCVNIGEDHMYRRYKQHNYLTKPWNECRRTKLRWGRCPPTYRIGCCWSADTSLRAGDAEPIPLSWRRPFPDGRQDLPWTRSPSGTSITIDHWQEPTATIKKIEARRRLHFTSIGRKDKTLKHISQPSDGGNQTAKRDCICLWRICVTLRPRCGISSCWCHDKIVDARLRRHTQMCAI